MANLNWNVPDVELDELQRRLNGTRWPQPWPVQAWSAGTDSVALQRLTKRWADEYDWRTHETWINDLPHEWALIDGVPIHYLRFRSSDKYAVPIVLTNGWPSSFLELVKLAQILSTPAVDGIAANINFDVVVPSLPGFAFSPQRPSVPSDLPTHEIWARLMTEHVGARRYFAHGGDLGSGVTARLASAHREQILGIHVMSVGSPPNVDALALSIPEQEYLREVERWTVAEGSYMHQQSTRPLSLAYGLSDSPTGLLAWLLEKYRAWSDNAAKTTPAFYEDFLLTQASLYWFTNTIGTSMRPYFEYGRGVDRALKYVDAPTAVALFPADLAHPPRTWAERTYNVVRWTEMPRGGHFAPIEEPELVAADITAFASTVLQ